MRLFFHAKNLYLHYNTIINLDNKAMRTNILFLSAILVSVIILSSCGDKAKTEDNSIVGKWEFNKTNYDVETSDSATTAKITTYLTESTIDIPYFTVEFTSDGKVNNSIGINGTYSISGDKITITYDNKTHYRCEYEVKGDTIFFLDPIDNVVKDGWTKRDLGIDNSVEIKKAVVITNLVRKK